MRTPSRVECDLEILKFAAEDDAHPQVVPASSDVQLQEDDLVAFRLTNRSAAARMYATLLFIDTDYGITPIYPREGELAVPIDPGSALLSDLQRVTAETTGLEHVVAIAVKAVGALQDFTTLAQDQLQRTRAAGAGQTPLARLLDKALYGAGSETRGLKQNEVADHDIQIISWRTSRRAGARRAEP